MLVVFAIYDVDRTGIIQKNNVKRIVDSLSWRLKAPLYLTLRGYEYLQNISSQIRLIPSYIPSIRVILIDRFKKRMKWMMIMKKILK